MEKLAYRLKDSFSVFKEKLTSPKAVRIYDKVSKDIRECNQYCINCNDWNYSS